MRTFLRSKVTLLFMTLGLLVAIPAIAYASSVDVAVVDVDVAPANSADLQPNGNANLKYTITVSGNQVGTATFEINKDWELKNGAFTGSNPEEFTVPPRAGGDPATVITRTGTLHVDSTQPDVLGKLLTVSVFDITNTNTTGAKLTAGTSGTYTVNVDGTKPTIMLTSPEDGKTYAVNSSLTASYTCQDTGGTGIKATGGCVGTQANGTIIDTSTAGPRTFTVTATDKAGNVETVTHNYSVGNPNTAPQVSVSGVTNSASYEIGSVPSATCDVTDTEDGNSSFAATLSAISGTLKDYGLGSQTASCSYTDQGGLGPATDSVTYSIVDTGNPTITDRGFKSGTAGDGGWYTSAVTNEFRATDSGAGFQTTTPPLLQYDFTQSSGTAEGSTVKIASGTVQDVAGNTGASIDSAAYKIDLSNPTNVAFVGGPAASGSYDFGSVPAAPTCTADDAVSGLKSCVVSGYSTAVGPHTLTATATDNAGRTATATRSYTVNPWNATGFYSPVGTDHSVFIQAPDTLPTVNDTGVWNTVKGGSTVPLKFNLFVGGTEKTTTSGIALQAQKLTKCESDGIAVGDPVDFTTTDTTSLRYSGTPGVDGQFIQNWKTSKVIDTTCYRTAVTFADGSSIYGFFKLLK